MSSNATAPGRPRTIPVTPEIAPQIVSFKPVRKAFILINSRPKPHETMFASRMMTVPPCYEVHAHRAAIDADGDPIPGTYVVEDDYQYFQGLGEIQIFDAERAVVAILGIRRRPDGTASELTSIDARVGLSLLPMNPTKELWQAVFKAGEDRAFLASVERARTAIETIDRANALRRQVGDPPIPGGPDYDYARELIAQYNELVKADTRDKMAPHKREEQIEAADAELEFQIFMKAMVQQMVDKAAEVAKIDKFAEFDRQMKDPEIRRYAQKSYRMRKRGHLPIPDEDLEAAQAEGREVEE